MVRSQLVHTSCLFLFYAWLSAGHVQSVQTEEAWGRWLEGVPNRAADGCCSTFATEVSGVTCCFQVLGHNFTAARCVAAQDNAVGWVNYEHQNEAGTVHTWWGWTHACPTTLAEAETQRQNAFAATKVAANGPAVEDTAGKQPTSLTFIIVFVVLVAVIVLFCGIRICQRQHAARQRSQKAQDLSMDLDMEPLDMNWATSSASFEDRIRLVDHHKTDSENRNSPPESRDDNVGIQGSPRKKGSFFKPASKNTHVAIIDRGFDGVSRALTNDAI